MADANGPPLGAAPEFAPANEELARFQRSLIPPTDLSNRMRLLIDTVHDRLFDPALNVDMLRAVCQIRDHNISSEFRHRIGVSIREYIEALRFAAANRLVNGGVPVTLAARNVGFSSVQTFYRARARRQARDAGPQKK